MVTFLFAGFIIAFLSLVTFCVYCGLEKVGETLKKDGIKQIIKTAAIIYVAIGIILLVTFRVGNALFPAVEPSNNIEVIDV